MYSWFYTADVGINIINKVVYICVCLFIVCTVTYVDCRHRKANKASVLHTDENPSYSITTFNREVDSKHNKTSNEAVTDVTHLDENPSYCITTFNKRPNDNCETNMCAGNI